MAELPQELIGEILPRLPVKTLKRFRCLSKPQCELIDSPHFIDSHLSKFSQNPKLIYQDPSKKKFHVCDVNFDLEKEDETLRLGKPVSSLWKLAYGYCKGLYLLYRGKFKFSLWNPSTRKSRNLPDCPVEAQSDNQIYKLIGSGLSFDDSINDFKAFCIVYFEQKIDREFEIQVWIYRLKSNSWRKSSNWDFPHILFMNITADHVLPGIGYFTPTDGVIHWVSTWVWIEYLNVLGYAKGGDKIVLDLGVDCFVSYDLKEKCFAKVQIDKDPNWKFPIPYLQSLVSVGGGA